MDVTFDSIHEVVIETLNLEKDSNDLLKIIGKWYYKFLTISDEKFEIYIPKYDEDFINACYNYIRLFSLTFRLIKRQKLTSFENTCLFNVFDFSKRNINFINNSKSTFDFVKEDANIIYWSDNILIPKNRFTPIFIKNQIENANWGDTYNTFKLFSIIENKQLIKHPILIDITKDLCLSLSNGENILFEDLIQFITIKWDTKTFSQEDAIELEDKLLSQNITHQVSIKYPYHRNIHSYLLEIGDKRMTLNFNTRFYYQSISNEIIYLLPKELDQNLVVFSDISTFFNILDTSHNIALFNAMNDFKSSWQAYNFNKFTTPFPKYWFLMINQSITKEEWFEMFKFDYPDVSNRPIINNIKIIIDLLYNLNWSKAFIEKIEYPLLLLPDLKGLNKKKLEKIIISFKNYLLSINTNTVFIDNHESYEYNNYDNLLVLDGFNIINLLNITQKNNKFQILIPDFLHFNYQPWIRYFLLNYQFEALLNSKRELLDDNYTQNLEVFSKFKLEIIKDIKIDILNYRKKYNIKEEIIEFDEDLSINEDLIFGNDEELVIHDSINQKTFQTEIEIETTDNKIYLLKGNNHVLLQRSTLISCPASLLTVGDMFISYNEINIIIDKDEIINKLSRIPETVINFQIMLSKMTEVYQTLANQGLVYETEKYFNDTYLISEDEFKAENFKLPKKKENWKVICEFLRVNNNDSNQAWISYYGRKHINIIKNIYMQILNLCIDGEYLNQIENPELISKIIILLDENKEIFDEGKGTNTFELANSILSAIINEISFHQVKEIKIL